MTKGIFFWAAVLIMVVAASLFSSCKHDTNPQPLEPISLVMPDTPIVTLFAGDSLPLEIKFTTDRPIDWVLGKYDIDTLIDSTNYVPTYPDTLFLRYLYSGQRSNLYTYTGTYYIPDALRPFSIIRFKITFLAGTDTLNPIPGVQNYPRGTTGAEKDFTVNIR